VTVGLLETLHYMAPELTRAAHEATPASDQYSIGVMLYEAATGRRPFQGEMHAIVTGTCPRPREINPALDAELEAIIVRAMHRDPKKRYPIVRALGSSLLSLGSTRT
jgi:eukaryotic-like serine/threonine-protein kinase